MKNKCKGFVLLETLIVAVFMIGIFTFLYSAVIPLLGTYEDLTNILAKYVDMPFEKRVDLLLDSSIVSRVEKLSHLITDSRVSEEIEKEINHKIGEKNKNAQREFILREKMKAIQDELNETGDGEDSVDNYLKMLEENPYPERIVKKV